ncbi:hypothetical protein HGRIS_009440 [Hohenbuehelia grisea]|uniref:Uncharacterized protein n=1 Tax=Hohenbuehelia grisea TaxID=104357 RepID=A0ABR3J1E5_9AGAR
MSSTASTVSRSTTYNRNRDGRYNPPASAPLVEAPESGFPTPAVLRSIFSASRTPHEERSISRVAFFRFTGFLLSCLAISLVAARNKGIRNSAALLGVV